MSLRQHHVPPERLAALALVATRETADQEDHDALAHAATCCDCGWRLAGRAADLDQLRSHARHEADRLFDEAALDAQRGRIRARIAALTHSGRVIRFPERQPLVPLHVGGVDRRWLAAAAAAAFIIGLTTGQLLHVGPEETEAYGVSAVLERVGRVRPANDVVRFVNAEAPLTDEELLNEIDAAIQLRRAAELRALDALTPTLAEIR